MGVWSGCLSGVLSGGSFVPSGGSLVRALVRSLLCFSRAFSRVLPVCSLRVLWSVLSGLSGVFGALLWAVCRASRELRPFGPSWL